MVAHCSTAIRGGTCTDNECPKRHDVLRCEPCNCCFPAPLLGQHENGKNHLRNVASRPGPSSVPPEPPQDTSLASGSDVPTPAPDPRVTVSDEGGVDFAVEETGNAENPSFSSDSRTIFINRTEFPSSLLVKSLTLDPLPNPCFSASLVSESGKVRHKKSCKILVSFQAPRPGNFHAILKITFVDKLRPDDQEFAVTRELRGRATLPGGQTSNGDASETVTGDRLGCEGTGITVSPESVLEFSVERPQSDVPFPTQTEKLVIKKSSLQPLVSFVTAKLRLQDSVVGLFSAKFEGDSMRIKPNRQRTVTVSFAPQRDGLYDAVLELIFYDRKRRAEFVIERTLCGVARSLLSNSWAEYNEDISSDEEEVFSDGEGTGISVSDEDGLNFDIVERKQPDGPFDARSASLTIRNAEGFPPVIFRKARVKTTDGSEPSFAVIFDGSIQPTIHPGAERTVHITFRPKFAGVFQETLTLVFYDSQRSAPFKVVRTLQGTAGSRQDHNHFEYLNKEMHAQRAVGQQVLPRQIKLLWPADRNRKSRKLPEYEVPPIVQAAVDNVTRPYDVEAPHLITALNTPALSTNTYAQYFKALVNVEDGHQQRDVLNLPKYEVEVQQRGQQSPSVQIENKDEDLLPEVMIGDFLWLDDVQDDIRYEARVTDVYVFKRSRTAVLKMSLRLPTDFNLYRGATFALRFRLNRVTLRRQYHVLATLSTPQRRLLFPSVSDIKPIERRLSRAEIDDLQLFNESIRDDEQQLQTVISLLQQPKGTVPFIIYGPPGTGKTCTVVESIIQLVRRDTNVRVLACTPSNAAADLLVQRLAFAGLNDKELFRLNAYSRSEEEMPEDVQAFSTIPDHATLLTYRVVLSTCSSAGMLQALNVPTGHFSHIVIDEAAQAEEPLAMIPIAAFSSPSTNVILAGDPHQLGPVIRSTTASRIGLGKSYLKRLTLISQVYGLDAHSGTTIVDLQRNRRSHGAIIAWPNRYLYEDRMRACASEDVTHLLLDSAVLPKKHFPIVFHGLKGSERRSKHSSSYFNIHEASIVREYCQKLTTDPERKIYPQEIGVVAPYRAQVRAIRDLLKGADLAGVEVGSVEQFQGQERKVIIFATTRSNSAVDKRRALGFLQHRQRMNVAITRAQALLIVIGDPEVLGKDELWRTFLNYVVSSGGLKGKAPSWRQKDEVPVPGYAVIPRDRPVYGESFIGGKSQQIYRYNHD